MSNIVLHNLMCNVVCLTYNVMKCNVHCGMRNIVLYNVLFRVMYV